MTMRSVIAARHPHTYAAMAVLLEQAAASECHIEYCARIALEHAVGRRYIGPLSTWPSLSETCARKTARAALTACEASRRGPAPTLRCRAVVNGPPRSSIT